MSAKIKGYTIALDRDISEESSEELKALLLRIGGIIAVDQIKDNPSCWITEQRLRIEFMEKLRKICE